MSEEQGGGAGGDGQGGGAGAAEMAGGAGGAGEGGGAAPEWMASLPDDLKGDATLARYADVPALAKATLDLRRVAASRVIVPGEGATDADRNAFYTAIGRPESADKYEIPVAEGASSSLADAFKPVAFGLGLTAAQAKGIAEFNDGQVAAQKEAFNAASKAELDAFKASEPEYDAKLQQTKEMLKSLGIDGAKAEEIELRLGTGDMMKLFFGLAAKTGEQKRVDGDGGGGDGGGYADPDKAMSDKMQDATWRERAGTPGTPERAEYDRLVAAAVAKRGQQRR